MGVSEFFKRIKAKDASNEEETKADVTQDIEIEIDGNIDLFKDEKEQIMQGAKQLLEMGKADNMEDAIITIAVMFRGLKFREIKKDESGRTIVVLKETVKQKDIEINER